MSRAFFHFFADGVPAEARKLQSCSSYSTCSTRWFVRGSVWTRSSPSRPRGSPSASAHKVEHALVRVVSGVFFEFSLRIEMLYVTDGGDGDAGHVPKIV